MGVRKCVPLAVVVLAACSHGSGRSTSTAWNGQGTRVGADYVCRQYLKGPYVSAVQTTVGAVRDAQLGPSRGLAHRFPKMSDSDEAVWCWTGQPSAYNVYALTTDGQAVHVVANMGGVSPADAHGAPVVP